ncbi:hypothetical protein [Lactobacillus sp.]|uniref:hypothetical protein n=1 Tax=Lactobacillus sp. TaxID=1591 RepID=UPI00258AF00C|nr:hypothetical protein [Lactobacillus sp.]MCO6529102.1 hypothetical protein [Lactobacillus sp.]
MALNDARKRANKKWDKKNKTRLNYLHKRSNAKSFILKNATEDDLQNILEYVEQRKKELEK